MYVDGTGETGWLGDNGAHRISGQTVCKHKAIIIQLEGETMFMENVSTKYLV